jgi:hypothetical protein
LDTNQLLGKHFSFFFPFIKDYGTESPNKKELKGPDIQRSPKRKEGCYL